jgi:glyoxylase-like metal-dependent hydrolase (beta-lactamase superfamily II)
MHRLSYAGVAEHLDVSGAWLGRPLPALAEPDIYLQDGQELAVGGPRFKAIHCPGHTRGHMIYYGEGVQFSGAVPFNMVIGRFGQPGGAGRLLAHNIEEKVLSLPDETVVYPGDGPTTTIGDEKQHNLVLRFPRVLLGIDPGGRQIRGSLAPSRPASPAHKV